MTDVKWDLEWKDPPPKTWHDRLGPLMENPGRSAKIAEGPYEKISRTAWALRHKYKIPPGNWTFRVVKEGETGELYATYGGEESN